MFNRRTIYIIAVFFLLFLFQPVVSRAGITVISVQDIKDKEKTIQVSGFGIYPDNSKYSLSQKRKLAQRAAVIDGYRKLLERINDIQVDSETNIENYIVGNDSVKVKISGIVRGAKIISVRHLNQDSVEVDMEIILGKDFYEFWKPYIKESKE